MKRTDEMIALCTLYNKLDAKYSNKTTVERTFREKAKELIAHGAVSTEAVKDALYCFVPSEREKQIKAYRKEGQTKDRGYSSQSAADKFDSLIDEVLSDDAPSNISFSSNSDPCSRSGGGRSSC